MKRTHWPFLLLAVIGALSIKLSVHEALQLTETTFDARLQYELPDESVILVERVEEVKIRLRGPGDVLAGINPFSVNVQVTVRPGELGKIEITEDRMEVSKPRDLEVLSVEPNRLLLTLEERMTRTVPIQVAFSGEPAAGALPQTPVVNPETASITGPRSRVEPINKLMVPINLDGHAFSFDETTILSSPDPLVRVIEPSEALVRVPMELPEIQGLLDLPEEENSPS